jgi:hypothetical protein
MEIEHFLTDLRDRGVRLTREGDRLVAAPRSKLTDHDRNFIRENNPILLAILGGGEAKVPLPAAPEARMDLNPSCPRCGGPMPQLHAMAPVCPTCGAMFTHEPIAAGTPGLTTTLRRCGSLLCRTCGAMSPSAHREGCAFPRFDKCDSRWWWLSVAHDAIKCVGCSRPASMSIVRGWILAPPADTPGEILSLMRLLN